MDRSPRPTIDAVPSLEQLKSRFVCAAEFLDGQRSRLSPVLTEDHREAMARMLNNLGLVLFDLDEVLNDARCPAAADPIDFPSA